MLLDSYKVLKYISKTIHEKHMVNFAQRKLMPEQMDDPNLDLMVHRQALRGLVRLNRFGGGLRNLWKPIQSMASKIPKDSMRILDLATGSGDVPIYLACKTKETGMSLVMEACDISSTALEDAKEKASRAKVDIRFFQFDVTKSELPNDYDIIICNQFLHHLTEEQVVILLKKMANAALYGIAINDLLRSRWNFLIVSLASHLFTRSSVVRFDGPQSIRAAFTIHEMKRLAKEAGLTEAILKPCLPAHFILTWMKTTPFSFIFAESCELHEK